MFSRVKPQRPSAMKTKNSRMTSGRRCRAKVTTWRMENLLGPDGPCSGRGARRSVYPRRPVDEERAAGHHPLARVQAPQDLQHVAGSHPGRDAAEHEAVAVQGHPDARLRAAVDHRADG